MQLKWTRLAVDDLDQMEVYISREHSGTVAVNVVLKVIDTTELVLREHPSAGRVGRVKGTRELVIDGVPYVVIYQIMSEPSQVQLLRVLHEARRWPKN